MESESRIISGQGGILIIKFIEAKLTRDTEWFGKMDPYCKIEGPNGMIFKTKVHNKGGKNPKWGDEFEIPFKSMEEDIKIWVMDEDVTTDDNVGMAVLKCKSLAINNGVNSWYDITYNAKVSGKIHLLTKFATYAKGESRQTVGKYQN